ncbi:MAG TPA: response regulator [Pyrinomonadaceae bacterium]
MHSKTVVIVEDLEPQRTALRNKFERRGFRVGTAANVAEARRVIAELGEEIDVMVLDMRLEDPEAPDTTGADIGIEVQDQHPDWLPEYLIHSQFSEVNYYRLALRLGAAAYLSKLETNLEDVVRHVRALALRRALRLERPKVAEKLRVISESTKNLSVAVRRFCRELLAGELDACLGAPYVLLLTDEGGTQIFATNTDLPATYESFYTTLQAMAHGISNFSVPYKVSEEVMRKLPPPANDNEARIYERLPKAAFIPLANVKNFRLSLGLFEPEPGTKYPEDAEKLAIVLAQYVRSTIVEHFLRILVHLDSQKKAMLKSTSHLCVFLGQDQQGIIEEGLAAGDLREGGDAHRKLIMMADDLWQTGTILANVANSGSEEEYASFEVGELVEKAFRDLKERMNLRGVEFGVEGSCEVRAKQDDMYIAVIRVLQWLAQRRIETPPELDPRIWVRCARASGGSRVTFEDRSDRLPKKLREQLFMPFSVSVAAPVETEMRGPGLYLPLYLAQMLVEEKYGGVLDDKSDDLEGDVGHRLVMRFDSLDRATERGPGEGSAAR